MGQLAKLESILKGGCPHLFLVIAEDEAERESACRLFFAAIGASAQRCIDITALSQECATRSLFALPRVVHFEDVDGLKADEMKQLVAMLERQLVSRGNAFDDEHLFVCLEGKSVRGALLQLVERVGVVYQLGVEKVWEKEQRLIEELRLYAQRQGVVCSQQVAKMLLMATGPHKPIAMRELEKVLCYIGTRTEIVAADIHAIVVATPQQTLWQLADALFAREGKTALQTLRGLLQEQVVPLVIVAALRTQTETALQMLTLSEQGAEAVRAQFPYLKGGLYDKKIGTLRACGRGHLEQIQEGLFEAECALKNSQTQWPLEKLIVQVTR